MYERVTRRQWLWGDWRWRVPASRGDDLHEEVPESVHEKLRSIGLLRAIRPEGILPECRAEVLMWNSPGGVGLVVQLSGRHSDDSSGGARDGQHGPAGELLFEIVRIDTGGDPKHGWLWHPWVASNLTDINRRLKLWLEHAARSLCLPSQPPATCLCRSV